MRDDEANAAELRRVWGATMDPALPSLSKIAFEMLDNFEELDRTMSVPSAGISESGFPRLLFPEWWQVSLRSPAVRFSCWRNRECAELSPKR